jgi:hypothetical protein
LTGPRARAALLFLPVVAAALLIYAPDVGHGFVKDDFSWIARSRAGSLADLPGLFARADGFYRPLVSVSFALNEWACGLAPRCYGLVNLGLALLVAAELAVLARALGLGWGPAGVAASLWLLNWHGMSMAVLWISGRTALLLVAFALAAAMAVLRGWRVAASLCGLLALLCKEEAVVLPLVLLVWAAVRADPERLTVDLRRASGFLLPFGLALAVYFALRSRTGAFDPSSAPPFYRPTFAPAALGRNLLEYADRAATMAAVVTLAACAVARRWPIPSAADRRILLLGAVWCLGGFALTVFLPVRSSLYAVLPSAGLALAAAALCGSIWPQAGTRAHQVLVAGGGLLALALVPVHWSRNVRWVAAADVSAAAVARVRDASAGAPPDALVLLRDDPGTRNNLASAFGTLVEDAVRLVTGGRVRRAWIEPPPPDWPLAGLEPPRPGEPVICLQLRDRLVRDCAP